jgi:hypothetical protein
VFRIGIIFLLNEVEDVEVLRFAIREETVHRVLLIFEELKGNGQPWSTGTVSDASG